VSLFLTGTGTGVGKTFVAIELLHWLRSRGIRAVGMKPICCGDREDARRLLAASAEGISIEELNPVWLQSPVAPSVAAQIEQVEIDLGRIRDYFRSLSVRFDTVIVEGVGGGAKCCDVALDARVEAAGDVGETRGLARRRWDGGTRAGGHNQC